MPRRIKLLMLAASGAVIMALSVAISTLLETTLPQLAQRASVRIESRAARAAILSDQVLRSDPERVFRDFEREFSVNSIALYLFRNQTLLAWNNAQIPLGSNPGQFEKERGIARLQSGYYYYVIRHSGDSHALALFLLKPTHELQNRYLSNDFVPWLGLPATVQLKEEGVPVISAGSVLFHVAAPEKRFSTRKNDNWCLVSFLGGFVLLLISCLFFVMLRAGQTAAFILVSVFVLRIMMLAFRWPGFFYNTTLYDVRIFGNADAFFNGYLGDILLNSMLLIGIAASLNFADFFAPRVRKYVRVILLFSALFVVAYSFNDCIGSLVSNSTLNFNFLDFLNLSPPVFVALLALAMMCTAIFLLLRSLTILLRSFRYSFLLTIVPQVIFSVSCLVLLEKPYLIECFWLPAAGLLILATAGSRRIGPVAVFALFLLVMSAFTSAIMSRFILLNESRDLQVLTLKLGERQDPVLENEFVSVRKAIQDDVQLTNLLRLLPASAESVRDLVNSRYLSGYFKRYVIEYSLFDQKCRPLLAPNDAILTNEGYFIDQLRFHSDSVSHGLYFVVDYRKNARYIGILPMQGYRLYLLMQPKQFEELGSFPDLLLDESQQRHEKLTGFSYAVYRAGQNTSNYGSLNYPPFLPDSAALARAEPDQVHWFFEQDDFTTIIISRPARNWAYFFTFNSYLLLLFSLVGYLLYTAYSFLFTDILKRSSLTRRIQTIIIVLLLLAMSAIGYTSATLVRSQFSAENKKELREKTEIIFTDLSRVFTPAQLFDLTNREAVNTRLNEYSRLFNTDVSLFDSNGFLYATSQPRLYSLGLAARHAHPEAIHRLSGNQTAAVTINERAGSLSYTTLYTALYSPGSSKPAGYINLPYFARQSDLAAELSGIVNGLVNVYVLLFVLSILAGLILAGYITRPLRLVQEQIGRISLGRSNQKISWQGTDELGRLIAEYNQMLVKLEESATLLAQSERESAWREMAKQVAHEIKNPLTPMKLNLQYLQRLMETDPEGFREKFSKASGGIIEQIDSLANIANEFSHFAKLPVTQVQPVNIAEVIGASLQLFEHRGRITIKSRIPEEQLMVIGDRDQCLRIFNNLFTNAVQALQETEDPWIEIGRQLHPGKVVILVRDNGSGIDDELKPRIFTPNFTTKTTGSGLGLAMVKNIMEGFGGKIWFSSEKGLGTIFYLEFVSA